jgi:protein TonB
MGARTAKLAVYARPAARDDRNGFLTGSLGLSLLVLGGIGLLLLAMEIPTVAPAASRVAHRIAFRTPSPVVVPQPAPEPASEPEPAAPEINPATRLDQPIDRPTPTPVPAVTTAPEPAPAPPAPRRVYGVRKVMARGLGSGGAAGAELVVKRGNVLDGVADDLTATEADLQGQLAALSTVERAPEPIHQVKPRYSEQLVTARASGVVTARLLVDGDGSVAAVDVLEDIGHDSAALATRAFKQFRFRPAMRHGEPVAVWIVFRMRFEFQE